ncbi:MAG: lysophospholipid acyltransferase family protein [Desulfatibacillaceae bacterium]
MNGDNPLIRFVSKMYDGVWVAWTLFTMSVYTLFFGVSIMLVAPFSRTGNFPYTLGRAWAWLIMRTNRVRVEVEGMEKLAREKSYVFMANHASNLDPPAVAVALRRTLRFVAKGSLRKIPVFGLAARLVRIIFIERGNTPQVIRSINAACRDLRDGVSAFFFAEGTRSPDGTLLPFKKGGVRVALASHLPIVPVTIVGSNRLLPKKGWRIRPGVLRVIVGEPVDTEGYGLEDMDKLLSTVRERIAVTLMANGMPAEA